MEHWTTLPDIELTDTGIVSKQFIDLKVETFHGACDYVHRLPYGYNSDRDDLMILFKEKMGTCTTKHAVIATLAFELGLPVFKNIGIYAMTEDIVAGCRDILDRFNLPYIPMVHCFLMYESHRVDLTEGNFNGKKRSIDDFLMIMPVPPDISAAQEYLLYRHALTDSILRREEMQAFKVTQVLQARELGLALLQFNIEEHPPYTAEAAH